MRTAAFLPDGDAWTAIFGILLNGARDRYRQTAEYRHCLERRRQLDNDLTYGLLDEQKEMVDEALLELDATAEEESRFLYQQGPGRRRAAAGNPGGTGLKLRSTCRIGPFLPKRPDPAGNRRWGPYHLEAVQWSGCRRR